MRRKAQLYLYTVIVISILLSMLVTQISMLNSEVQNALDNIVIHKIYRVKELHNSLNEYYKFYNKYKNSVAIPFVIVTNNSFVKNITGINLNLSKVLAISFSNLTVVDDKYEEVPHNYTTSANTVTITISIPNYDKAGNFYIFKGYILLGNFTERKTSILNPSKKFYYYINYQGQFIVDLDTINFFNTLHTGVRVTVGNNSVSYVSNKFSVNLPVK